ncbi:MAG: hypothetical protein BGN93_05560 [Acinetobacter sp. 39-4]|nr:MAG: hypothetical protein BGN93_05560 [Acinetobacter sp. 39-4]OJU91712.1 MAG: hypothetical protein BGO19_15255 [Acinetobacter sp. 38-8]
MEHLNTVDYLFLKFRANLIKLDDVSKEYSLHLCKEKVLEKVRLQKFPFVCFRIDESPKGPFFVEITELAKAFDEIYRNSYKAFQNSTIKAMKPLV